MGLVGDVGLPALLREHSVFYGLFVSFAVPQLCSSGKAPIDHILISIGLYSPPEGETVQKLRLVPRLDGPQFKDVPALDRGNLRKLPTRGLGQLLRHTLCHKQVEPPDRQVALQV